MSALWQVSNKHLEFIHFDKHLLLQNSGTYLPHYTMLHPEDFTLMVVSAIVLLSIQHWQRPTFL